MKWKLVSATCPAKNKFSPKGKQNIFETLVLIFTLFQKIKINCLNFYETEKYKTLFTVEFTSVANELYKIILRK